MSTKQQKRKIRKGIEEKRAGRNQKKARSFSNYAKKVIVPLGMLSASVAFASPQGGVVVGGKGNIQYRDSNTTIVEQQTGNLALDWQSFNLGTGDLVRFKQPSASSAVLNRILDQNPSQIFGTIEANGRVFLSNPNGMIFGATATVNVGSLVATSLQMETEDFMAGNYRLYGDEGSGEGRIINRGLIQAATGGNVALIGKSVSNEGVIQATLGSVILASGKAATLDFDGDGMLQFKIEEEIDQNLSGVADAVSNSGLISADGGNILLTAGAAKDVFSNVVNNEGIIKAATIENKNGVIRLVGTGSGVVANSGSLLVKGDETGERGGSVQVLGEKVGLFDGSRINASGEAGGGEVLIGGDFQGKNPEIMNASRTYVGPDVSITADALTNGDGGKVIVWADEVTRFYGSISARGGAESGDGGFVEVSGKDYLDFNGMVNTLAPMGSTGTLLLDPTDLIITNEPATNGTDDANIDGADGLYAFGDTPASAEISAGKIEGLANTTSIKLEATNSITIENLTAAGKGGVDGELTLSTDGTVEFLTGAGGFSMDSSDKINVTGTGTLLIDAIAGTSGGTGDGTVSVGALQTASGGITLRGTTITLGSDITGGSITFDNPVTLAADVALDSGGGIISIGSIDGGSHDLTIAAGTAAGTTTVSGAVSNLGDGTGAALIVDNAVTGLVDFQSTFGGNDGITAGANTSLKFADNVTLADGSTASNMAGAVEFAGLDWSNFDNLTIGALTLSGGPVSLDSNAGAIAVTTITGAQDLTLAAGIAAGTTTVTGAVTNLGDGTGAALIVDNAVTGLVRFQGTVGANSGLNAVDTSGHVRFDDDVTLAAGDTATTLNGDVTLDGLTFTSAGDVTFGNAAAVDQVTLSGTGVMVTTAAAGTNITFTALVDGGQDLTLTSGTGNIDINGVVGGVAPLGAVTITSANDVTADLAFSAASVSQVAGNGTTTFTGALATTAAAGIEVDGTNFDFNDTVSLTLGDLDIDATGTVQFNGLVTTLDVGNGLVTVTNGGVLTIMGTGDMNLQGAFLQDGGGTVSTAGDITTTGDDITLTDAVTLSAGPVALDTGAGVGTITFNSTLDGTTDHVEDLTLTAGTGNIDFDGIVGGTKDLGEVTIVSATNVTADAAFNAEQIDQTAGTGTTTFTGAIQTLGTLASDGLDLNGTNFTISSTVNTGTAGDVKITNSGALSIAAAADMTLGGLFLQDGGGTVSTAGDITTTGDDITFTDDTTLASDVALSTGGGDIQFAGDVTGPGSLTLDSGTGGTIGVTGIVDGVTTLDITNSNGATFSSAVTVTTLDISDTEDGQTVQFQGNVVADTLTTTANLYNLQFDEDLTIANDVTFAAIGNLTVGDGTDDVALFNGGVDTTGVGGTVSLAGNVRTSSDQADFAAITLGSDTTIDTTNDGNAPAGANVNLGTVDGTPFKYDLTIKTGISSAVKAESFGGGGQLEVQAADLEVTSGITGNLKAGNSGGNFKITLPGTVTGLVDIEATGNVTTASAINAGGDVSIDTAVGDVILGGDIVSSSSIYINKSIYEGDPNNFASGNVRSANSNQGVKLTGSSGNVEIYAGGQIGEPNAKLELEFAQGKIYTGADILYIEGNTNNLTILRGVLRGTDAMNQATRESGLKNVQLSGYVDPALFEDVPLYGEASPTLMLPLDQQEESDEYGGVDQQQIPMFSRLFQKGKSTLELLWNGIASAI